jgi:prepilin-type N-terminal cleavage/methylation domain-containing protein
MKKGFTLIELLVIIGILSVLSSILIINIHGGSQMVTVLKEQAKVISIISRAKSLGVATFGQSGVSIPCGYGVHFEEPNIYLIFKDLAENCRVSDNKYSGENELFQSFQLDSTLNFDHLTVSDVIFIPPNPSVIITPAQDQAEIIIKSLKADNSATIKINSAGQISS